MPNKKSSLSFSISDTIKDIPESSWLELFSEEIIEGYGYQKTLEESNIKEFSFKYLIGKYNDKIVAIFPFFIMDFSFDTLIPPPFHIIAYKLRKFLRTKLLFIGTPTTERFYAAISKEEDLKIVINKALESLSGYCKNKKVLGISFYNISEKDKPIAEYLTKKNFIELESLPTTLIRINTPCVESYINSLSRNMRKDVRKKLRNSSLRAQLRTEVCENIDGIIDDIYKLYLNNFDDSDVRFEILTPEYFKNICKNMPGVAKFFITYDKNKIVAFNLCLIKNDTLIDKFIGLDLEVAHQYHLYFTTFFHNLAWCIENGVRFYEPGITDYHPKIRLGAKLIPLYIYVKACNPLLHLILRPFAKLIEPKNMDPSLKDIKWFKKDSI